MSKCKHNILKEKVRRKFWNLKTCRNKRLKNFFLYRWHLFKGGAKPCETLNKGVFRTLSNIQDGAFCEENRRMLHIRYVAGFFEMYKDLVTIILREHKKIAEYLLLVDRPNKFQCILLTQ